MRERIEKAADEMMARKAARFGPELMRAVEKQMLLQTLDHLWREHLATLDHLRSVVGFRGYAQRDPLNEYKTEGFELFQAVARDAAPRRHRPARACRARRSVRREPRAVRRWKPTTSIRSPARTRCRPRPPSPTLRRQKRQADDPSTWGKVGRNELCPCGSGKKFKQCHGVLV